MWYRDAYDELSRLLRCTCTLPVTSAEAERSFGSQACQNSFAYKDVRRTIVKLFGQIKHSGTGARY